jgi:glycosyltransferase involved in cell wall biosynthesis/predicted SAM-dependent methyltransferase
MKSEISLCIIVRNNESTLDKCLSTFCDLVEEIIIVDTGSTDTTKEIAKKYTDKIYDFKWIDDFSAARNYSLSLATKPWIFWVDSDDFILDFDKEIIRNLDFKHDMYVMKYQYHPDFAAHNRERIWKRELGLKFNGEIHECVTLINDYVKVDATIQHQKQHGTSERNINLLKNSLRKNPNNSRNLYYLAKELFDSDQKEESIKYYKKFIDKKDCWYEDKIVALETLAIIYQSDDHKFLDYLDKSIRLEGSRQEPYYLKANYYFSKSNWLNAYNNYKICANLRRNPDILMSFEEEIVKISKINIVLCLNNLGLIKEAYEANEEFLKEYSDHSNALNNRKIFESILKQKKDGLLKKLNLGCGSKDIPGYISCDIYNADNVQEVFQLYEIPYNDNTISAIYSEHALEHVGHERAKLAIKEWSRVLVSGGELLLKIPDAELCCKEYLNNLNNPEKKYRDWYKYTIWGYQKDANGSIADYQFHTTGFDKVEIKDLLEQNNFCIEYIKNYNGYDTPSIEIKAYKTLEKKVCFVSPYDENFGPTRIRRINVSKELVKQGIFCKLTNSFQEAQNFDIIIVCTFDQITLDSVKFLKSQNKQTICDLCEDLVDEDIVKEILKTVDKVVCCSTELEKKAKEINNNTFVIEDAFEV